jgi:hypothetical protein
VGELNFGSFPLASLKPSQGVDRASHQVEMPMHKRSSFVKRNLNINIPPSEDATATTASVLQESESSSSEEEELQSLKVSNPLMDISRVRI